MPVYHIDSFARSSSHPAPSYDAGMASPPLTVATVLFRLKQGVTQAQVETWGQLAKGMVGKIPGLVSLQANTPLPICLPRAKGFDMGLVAVLETPEHVATYATHPAHLEVHKMREELCEDTLAYDMEF